MVLTFILDAIPKPSKAHELIIFPFHEVWNLFLAAVLFQPLKKPLSYYYTAFLFLHCRPHASIFVKRVITTVDGFHHAPVVWISLGPKGNQACDNQHAFSEWSYRVAHPIS